MAEEPVSVIEAASAGVKDMADGSLRITFEFEPRNAAAAFALFGPRGRSVAVAALRDGHGAAGDDEMPVQPAPRKDTRGPLCREACDLCWLPAFHDWAAEQCRTPLSVPVPSEHEAKAYLLWTCGIESRKELDTDPRAADRFINRIRMPFMKHMQARKA